MYLTKSQKRKTARVTIANDDLGRMPKAMSTFDFFDKFRTEDDAYEYLKLYLWDGDPFCPLCMNHSVTVRRNKKYTYRCPKCKKDFGIRTFSIMEGSPIPLRKWLFAAYLFVISPKGISSIGVSKHLGVKNTVGKRVNDVILTMYAFEQLIPHLRDHIG